MEKSKPIKWETISVQEWGDKWQSNDYQEILRYQEHKLQIRLHHDWAYPTKQSYANVSRWDGIRWHVVASDGQPHFPSVRDQSGQKTSFSEMRLKMLKLAEAVIF